MDGPRIAWMCKGEETDGITAHLSKLEQTIYERISPPDCLILLHVSPNVALRRKPDHAPEEIERKIQAVERMDRQGLQIIDIDADQPFERTALQTKSALWNIL
jgi:thymidylate kinase